jgi:Holliday junction resolvase RusA-like endonuclease
MIELEFTIPGEPKPKGRGRASVVKGTNRARIHTPDKTREAEQTLAARALPFRPDEPWDCPIHLDVIFVLPMPKTMSKWKVEAVEAGCFFHTKKPDRDNLLKLLKDALNGLMWIDDSQVCSGTEQKVYGHVPRTWVRMRKLEQMTKEHWAELKARERAEAAGRA